MRRLGPCLTALRVLASSKDPHRHLLIERNIDDYLRTHPVSLAHALERLRRAIHYEELQRRKGEDWSIAKEYIRLLLRRMM
jgi:predicted Zn-dependent protease